MATAKLPGTLPVGTDLASAILGIPKNEWTANGATAAGAAVPFSLIVNEAVDTGVAASGHLTTANGEVLHYSAVVTATKTFTIDARAQQGTTAAAIDNGSLVGQYLTRDDWQQIAAELLVVARFVARSAREDVTGATTVDLGDATKPLNRFHRLTGNVNYTFSNRPTRSPFTILTEQDATGGRTFTFTTTIKWKGGSQPAPSTAVGKKALWIFEDDGTDVLGDCVFDY